MRIAGRNVFAVLLLLTFVFIEQDVMAADLLLSQTGATTYAVSASALSGVHGMNLTISYDATSLANPAVAVGSVLTGAMQMPNSTNAGLIRFAAISAATSFKDSGPVITITFASRNGSGGITSFAAELNDIAGKTVSVHPSFSNSDVLSKFDPPAQPAVTPPVNASQEPPVQSPQQTTRMGTVLLPDASPQQAATVAAPAETAVPETVTAQQPSAPPKVAPESAPVVVADYQSNREEPVQQKIYSSIAERFRVYNGNKSLTILEALFAKPVTDSISQRPAVAISDGLSTIIVTVSLPESAAAPNFALSGARMKSVKRGKGATWVLELLPVEKAWQATLNIIQDSKIIEYPLTIAPALPKDLPVDAKSFARFMAERQPESKGVTHDLNGDGKRDYIDEYIFVANAMARKISAENKTKRGAQ